MNEALLKRRLVMAFHAFERSVDEDLYEISRHEDKITSGIPDMSISALGRTLWLEAKYACPSFTSRGIQELKMKRLDRHCPTLYIVWDELAYETGPRTFLFRPHHLRHEDGRLGRWRTVWDAANAAPLSIASIEGFDHHATVKALLTYLRDYRKEPPVPQGCDCFTRSIEPKEHAGDCAWRIRLGQK